MADGRAAERVVIIGADAAGMSAAHQALRTAKETGRALEVVALEATSHTSYSACGLPYWVAGDVASGEDLVARSAAEHRELGVDLRMGVRALGVDLDAGLVHTDSGDEAFDQLVVATGAAAIIPDWARSDDGRLIDGVGVVKTIDDGAAWLARLAHAQRVLVVGGGYIGVEMAEACLRRGHEVSLVTRGRVMSTLEEDQSARVAAALTRSGVALHEGCVVQGLEADDAGTVRAAAVAAVGAQAASSADLPCDAVVLALGVTPALDVLDGALPRGASSGLMPEATGRVADRVWAAGDCCEVAHRVTGRATYLPLGTHANKAGRVLGTNLGGGTARFPGALGTAITRFVAAGEHLEMSRTGLSSSEAAAAGIDAVALTTEGTTASGYMPEAAPVAITILAERGTRRLLGAQFVGGPGSGKRVDAVAAALWGEASVDDLAWMDLAYAPPFATAWEVTSVAARRLAERL